MEGAGNLRPLRAEKDHHLSLCVLSKAHIEGMVWMMIEIRHPAFPTVTELSRSRTYYDLFPKRIWAQCWLQTSWLRRKQKVVEFRDVSKVGSKGFLN